MAMTPSNESVLALFDALKVALDLPEGVTAFELRIAVDEVVMIKLEYAAPEVDARGITFIRSLAGKFALVDASPTEVK